MLPKHRLPFVIGLITACLLNAVGRADPPKATKTLALVGGRILTQTDAGAIEGTVLIQDGRIVQVGPDVVIPKDAERIDVAGMTVTPGLIDARSTLWMAPDSRRDGASDASLNVLDAIDPHAEDWREVARQGITTVYAQPAGSGILGGRGAVLRVGPAASVDEVVLRADAALQAALGAGGGNSLARYGQYEQLKRAFADAKKYAEEWKQFEAAKKPVAGGAKASEKKVGPTTSAPGAATKGDPPLRASRQRPGFPPGGAGGRTEGGAAAATSGSAGNAAKPKRDPVKDFLVRALRGEVPVRLEAHRADDIHNALRLADEFHLRIILEGLSDPRDERPLLDARHLPRILGPVLELEGTPGDRAQRPDDWLRSLASNAARWALGSFSAQPRSSRLLRAQAAAAVAQGIDPSLVLQALTRNAAEILGLGDRLGTVAPGKQADLAIFAGDPLDPAVPTYLVLVAGRVTYRADTKPAVAAYNPPAMLKPIERLPSRFVLQTQNLLGSSRRFAPGSLAVDAGKITAVGSALPVQSKFETINVGQMFVTPGLLAACVDLDLRSALEEPAEGDASHLQAVDVYDPDNAPARKLLRGGFLTVLATPGMNNVVAGTASVLRLAAAEPVLAPNAGERFVLTISARAAERFPASLAGQFELAEQVLAGRPLSTQLLLPDPARRQLLARRASAVQAVRKREQLAFFEANNRAEIQAALRLIAQFKLRALLVGPEEITPFIDQLKALGTGIVARAIQTSDYDRYIAQLVEAQQKGISLAFGGGSAEELRLTAALAVNAGMPRAAALEALTAADLLGLPEPAGRLKAGANADFVLWDRSPVELAARPLALVVDGRLVPARPSQTSANANRSSARLRQSRNR